MNIYTRARGFKRGQIYLTYTYRALYFLIFNFFLLFFFNALFKELVDSPQKRTEKTEEVSMIYL